MGFFNGGFTVKIDLHFASFSYIEIFHELKGYLKLFTLTKREVLLVWATM